MGVTKRESPTEKDTEESNKVLTGYAFNAVINRVL